MLGSLVSRICRFHCLSWPRYDKQEQVYTLVSSIKLHSWNIWLMGKLYCKHHVVGLLSLCFFNLLSNQACCCSQSKFGLTKRSGTTYFGRDMLILLLMGIEHFRPLWAYHTSWLMWCRCFCSTWWHPVMQLDSGQLFAYSAKIAVHWSLVCLTFWCSCYGMRSVMYRLEYFISTAVYAFVGISHSALIILFVQPPHGQNAANLYSYNVINLCKLDQK